jgi:uracil phosphoribosyltransferase
MKNLKIIDHPLVQCDLTLLRYKKTPSHQFRSVLDRIARLIAYEVTRNLKVKKIKITTPLEKTAGASIDENIVLVPILRAGLGLLSGFLEVMPNARVGHIGLYRNEETLKPVDYYFKVPSNIKKAHVIILDPMLATGGSAAAAITYLKDRGACNIQLATLVAAPEGVSKVNRSHPDVKIYTCALDRGLNKRGYILPGLGDAGDRIFGTE